MTFCLQNLNGFLFNADFYSSSAVKTMAHIIITHCRHLYYMFCWYFPCTPSVTSVYPPLSFFNISMLVKCSWIFTGCTNSKRLRNLTQSHNHMTRATPGTMSSFEIRDHWFFQRVGGLFPSIYTQNCPLLICQLKQSLRNAAFFLNLPFLQRHFRNLQWFQWLSTFEYFCHRQKWSLPGPFYSSAPSRFCLARGPVTRSSCWFSPEVKQA